MALFGSQWFANAGADAYSVDNSAMFNEPDDEYFTRTPTSASSQKTWTFSTWLKRGTLGSDQRIFTATNNGCELFFDANDKLNSYQYTSGSYVWNYITTQVFRDPHAWYNIVVRIDTTQSSSSDRVRLYVNGSQITDFDGTPTAPSQNATGFVNSAVAHYIGRYSGSNSMHYDGYLAETILIDGQSLAPASFGETDDEGVWRPINVSSSGLFDASNSVTPTATTWTLGSTMSAGTGTLDKSGAGGTSALYARMLEGDFKVTFTAAALNDALFGVFDYTEIGTFDASQDDGFLDSMTNSFWYDEGQTDVNYGSATVAASKTIAAGSVVTIERSGSTIKITDDGVDVHSFSQNFAGPVGFIAGHRNTGANSLDFNSISFDGVSGAGKNGFYFPYTDSGNLGGDYQTGGITSITLSGEWNGDTGDFGTLDTDIIATGGNQGAIRTNDTFTSDFAFDFVWKGGANPAYVGVYEIDEDGTFSSTASDGGMGSMTDSFYLFFTSGNAVNAVKGSSTEASTIFTAASGEVIKFQRSGSQFKVFEDGVLRHTFTGTSSNEVRILVGQSSSSLDWENFKWVTGGTTLGNPFTPVNSPTQTGDSPTKNYAVLSPLSHQTNGDLSKGNTQTTTGSADQGLSFATFPVTTGQKVYIEALCSGATTCMTGCVKATSAVVQNPASDFDALESADGGAGRLLHVATGDVFNSDGNTSASNYAPNDSVPVRHMIALDLVNDKIYWGDAGVGASGWSDGSGSFDQSFDNAVGVDLTANLDWFFAFRPFTGTIEVNFGATAFTVDPPTGYSSGYSAAIENENRETALTIEDGSAYFQTTAYTGTGSAREVNQSENSQFTPDFVWVKERGGANEHRLIDAVRGATETLYLGGSMGAAAEATESTGVTSFDSDGFSVGSGGGYNNLNDTYVGWQWLAGNSTASNSNGSITSTVSVNQTAGFSIVSWTGSGANATIGHGLNAVPSWILIKNLADIDSWVVYHEGTGATKGTALDTTGTPATASTFFNDTAPTSTVFSVGSGGRSNGSTDAMIAYCWCEKPGFSKFGTFEGNGSSTNGGFIELGFKPAWFMWKNIDSSTNGNWTIMDSVRDPFNMVESNLRADSTMAADTGEADLDFVSNGVKHRGGASARFNASATYIYMAFAEHPFAGTTPATARQEIEMFVLNNKRQLQPGKSWKDDDGFTHPSNWASAWSADEKTARGIKEVSIQTKPDDKFYWVTGPALDGSWTSIPKNLDDVKEVDDKGNARLDSEGNQLVTKGLKSHWITKTKETANSLLAPTDWQVVAKAERDRAIDSNVATYRAAVVAKCAAIEKSITDIADTAVPSGYDAAKIKGESERTTAEKKIISDYEAEVAPKFAAFKALFDAPTKTTTKTMTNGDGSTYEETTVEITGNPPIHDWPVMGE